MQETDLQHSMYATDSMDVQEHHHHHHQQETQIEDEGPEDVASGESIDNPHIRFDSHSSIHDGTAVVVPMNHNPHVLYSTATEVPLAAAGTAVDQLTLSFQGEVYVFDAVTPEKVQAVLLLLGGYEVPTGIPSIAATPQNPRALDDFPCRSSQPQRAASLNRFREKRKERCFDKKIRYTVRKEVALRMQRKKGQFTSSKSISDEGTSDCDGTQGGLLQTTTTTHEEQETLCTNCGVNSKSTPMMRRGPAGPRTLCNACGLKWANKGVLKDLSKVVSGGGTGGTGTMHSNNNIKGKEQNVVEVANNSGGNNIITTMIVGDIGKNHPVGTQQQH